MINFGQFKLKYLDDPKKALRFWMILTFLDLVVFGFLGLQLSLSALAEKKTKYRETKAQIVSLRSKKFILVDTEANLKNVSAVLPLLYAAIPDSTDYQSLLPELVTIVADNGFVMTNFVSKDIPTNEQASLTVQLSGNSDNVSSLVASLEKFSRRTSITSLKLDLTEPLARVDATLNVYFSNEEALDLVQSPDAIIDIEFLNKEFLPIHE